MRSASTSTRFASRLAARDEDRGRRQRALASEDRRWELHPGLARRAGRGRCRRSRARRLRADEPQRAGPDPPCPRRNPPRRPASLAGARLPRRPDRLEPPRPSGDRAAARAGGRSPVLGLVGPAAARRRPRDDGARPRPGSLPGVGDSKNPLDAWLQVRAHGSLRRGLRQFGLHRPRRRRAARSARGADPDRTSGRRAGVHCSGRTGGSRRALHPDRRDARAAQEPGDAGGRTPPSRRQPPARRRRRRGLGRPGGPRRPARHSARVRLRGRARPPLPGSSRCRLPVALRGLRHADHRGYGLRRARRRLGARVHGRGRRGRRGAGRPG